MLQRQLWPEQPRGRRGKVGERERGTRKTRGRALTKKKHTRAHNKKQQKGEDCNIALAK